MPSPFPGMDPYLEEPAVWPGLHTTLLTAIRAALTPRLPPGFYAEIEQHVWFRADEPPDGGPRLAKPDVFVHEGPAGGKKRAAKSLAVVEPTVRVAAPGLVRETGCPAVRIRDGRDRRVVTALELLSPSNKLPGPERERYLLKRADFVAAGTHLVEIDLLRAGPRLPVAGVPDGDYYVYVTDADYYTEVAVWVATVRDPLPVVPVPLPRPHAPIPLALRPCLDRAYDEANYGPQLNYAGPATPPLRAPDAAWAAELLRKTARKRK